MHKYLLLYKYLCICQESSVQTLEPSIYCINRAGFTVFEDGNYKVGLQQYQSGLDDIRLFSRTLDSEEITLRYEAQPQKFGIELVFHLYRYNY